MEKIRVYDVESFKNGLAVELYTTAYDTIYVAIWNKGRLSLFINGYETDCASDKHILSDEILSHQGVCVFHEKDVDPTKVKIMIDDLLHQYYGNQCEIEYEVTSEQLQKTFYHLAQ